MKRHSIALIALIALLCFFGLAGCGTDNGASDPAKGAEDTGDKEGRTGDLDGAPGDSAKGQDTAGNSGAEEGSGAEERNGAEEGNGTGDDMEKGSGTKGRDGTGDDMEKGNGTEKRDSTGDDTEKGSGTEERDGTEERNGTGLTGEETIQRLRIVDGAESGSLVLAGEGAGQVYTLSLNGAEEIPVFLDGQPAGADALEDGMMVEVSFDGTVLESYPSQLGEVYSLSGYSLGTRQNPCGTYYDLCGLYLQVLEDLWNRDPGLNNNISYVSVDLSEAPGGLAAGEREAIAWIFGCAHQAEALSLTLEELAEQGYLEEALPGSENKLYQWEDGVLFRIDSGESEEETSFYSLPVLKFNARKWRSPNGAYFFEDCQAVWPEWGTWSGYKIGGEAIS